jgi:hypothetical protein
MGGLLTKTAHHRGPGQAARTPCLGGPDADILIAPPPRNQPYAHLHHDHGIEITQQTPNHKHIHYPPHQQFHNNNDYSTYGQCPKKTLTNQNKVWDIPRVVDRPVARLAQR